MSNNSINTEEKRLILNKFNHRLNNDLQVLMAFIKLQKRFGIDNEVIVNFSYVSIASMSTIQNLMYKTDDEENFISADEFFKEFVKILEDYYAKFNIAFINEIENDFYIDPKKIFHVMLLINEMVNLSLDFSFKEESGNKISFNLEKNGEECLLTYCDNGSGIDEIISKSDMRTILFNQVITQLNGSLEESGENGVISIKFSYD